MVRVRRDSRELIARIHDEVIARTFLNSVPFDQFIPDWFPICTDKTVILGWSNPNLIGMFPCNWVGDDLEIHAAFYKQYRGAEAVLAGRSAISWLFDNICVKRIFSVENSKEHSVYATLCGLSRNGKVFEVIHG